MLTLLRRLYPPTVGLVGYLYKLETGTGVMVTKMEQGVFGTFAPAGEGEGYFAIPLVLWAFDRECKIKLHAVTLWATSSGRSTRSSPTCGTTAS